MTVVPIGDVVLQALLSAHKDGLSVREIGDMTGLPLGGIRGTLAFLELNGYVKSALVDGVTPTRRLYHPVRRSAE